MKRVLAVASGGGHWVQLTRLRPAWSGCAVHYVTTDAGQGALLAAALAEDEEAMAGFHVIPEANRWQKLRLLKQLARLAWLILRIRPHAVVTTGAAPGYFALRLGRLVGAKTIWVDSIANPEELSLSGKQVGPHADLWLTQWPDLGEAKGPHYEGSVI